MNHSFVVCDMEKSFADRLAGFVNKRHLCPYLMESVTDVGMLLEYGKKNCIEVLLIDELLYTEDIEKLNIGKVFLLTNHHNQATVSDGNRLYKYTPIPEIISVVMCDFAERNVVSTTESGNAKIIGAFTPAISLRRTSFLLTMALMVAEKKRVFYLNISSTYGYRKMLDKESGLDLSDVMYCIKTGNEDSVNRINDMVLSYGKLDYFLPATPVSDLHCVETEDWEKLFNILKGKDYDYIFVDLDESTISCFELLNSCDLIYGAYREDYICKNAFLEFEEILIKMGLGSIGTRLRKISPPEEKIEEISENLFEALKNSEMGAYVQEVLNADR